MPLDNSEEVLTSRNLVAPAPLDRKTIAKTLVARDAIPMANRYHLMKVAVQENGKEYRLVSAGDLTNTGWVEVTVSGIGEAPIDGSAYNRKDAAWEEAVAATAHDYKTWYIDLVNGLDTNDGSFASPVLTLQKAIDLREADGVIFGTLKIDGRLNIFEAITFSALSQYTRVIANGDRQLNLITNVTVQDCKIFFERLSVKLRLIHTSTLTTATCFDCHVTALSGSTVSNPAQAGLYVTLGQFQTQDLDIPYFINLSGTYCSIQGFGAMTLYRILMEDFANLYVQGTATVTTLTASTSSIKVFASKVLTIGTFTDDGVIFDFSGTGSLNVTGTRTSSTGEFAVAQSSPIIVDKDLTPSATSGDNEDSTIALTVTPIGYSAVYVNGMLVNLTGDLVGECYFSNDAGVSAKALGAATATDVLYWNGVIAGYDLAITDRIDLLYNS